MTKGSKKAGPTQKKKDSAKTKERILKAAEKLFAEKGFSGARTREIADLAGVQLPLIHRYFVSKEKLYLTVIEHTDEKIGRFIDVTSSFQGDFREKLYRLIDSGFDFLFENRQFFKLIRRDIDDGNFGLRHMEEPSSIMLGKLTDFFKEGIDQGFLENCDPRDLAFTLDSLGSHFFPGNPSAENLWGKDCFTKKGIERRKEHIKYIFKRLLMK